jgi:hypothetical protein
MTGFDALPKDVIWLIFEHVIKMNYTGAADRINGPFHMDDEFYRSHPRDSDLMYNVVCGLALVQRRFLALIRTKTRRINPQRDQFRFIGGTFHDPFLLGR